MEIPIKEKLSNSKKILLCGAGGGYDIYSGIPLYFTLKKLGKEVILANYSFSFLIGSGGERIGEVGWLISEDCNEMAYFPEKHLVEWLAKQGESPVLIGLDRTGVQPLKETMSEIVSRYEIDTLILVDGGTDSLMRGDETGLGTPTEDMTSIAAGVQQNLSTKLLVCVGFGIDHFHGVCHSQFLENVSNMIRKGGFLGANTFTKQEEEGKLFTDLVEYANQRNPEHPSIVANSIASSVEGEFGNYHATSRTKGSELYINPLMSFHWYFDLEKIAQEVLYLNQIKTTQTKSEVMRVINRFRQVVTPRKWKNIPL